MYKTNNYSEALYLLAKEFEIEKEMFINVKDFLKLLKNNLEFEEMFNSKLVSVSQKESILNSLEKDFNELFMNFLKVLNSKNDQKHLRSILKRYVVDEQKRQNIVIGYVYSSKQLENDFIEKIAKIFSDKVKKTVQLKNKKDSTLISGIKITLDNKVYNYSIKGKLDSIKEELLRR